MTTSQADFELWSLWSLFRLNIILGLSITWFWGGALALLAHPPVSPTAWNISESQCSDCPKSRCKTTPVHYNSMCTTITWISEIYTYLHHNESTSPIDMALQLATKSQLLIIRYIHCDSSVFRWSWLKVTKFNGIELVLKWNTPKDLIFFCSCIQKQIGYWLSKSLLPRSKLTGIVCCPMKYSSNNNYYYWVSLWQCNQKKTKLIQNHTCLSAKSPRLTKFWEEFESGYWLRAASDRVNTVRSLS